MIVELINTGSELMLGCILNTHQQWLCAELAKLGLHVTRQVAVPDTAADIEQAVRESLACADLVITTGGLGPTSDDITRERIAELLGRKLHEDAAILEQIKKFFTMRNRPMPENNRVQALVPDGAIVLDNPRGTAPGLAIEIGEGEGWKIEGGTAPHSPSSILLPSTSCSKKWLIMLPGPPRELRPMFMESVVPLLKRVLPPQTAHAGCTLRTVGIGESSVQEKIHGPLSKLVEAGLEVGYCAHMGQVDVRLSASGANAEKMVRDAEKIVREQFGSAIFCTGDEELESVVIRLLIERKQTLAVAESCTGGGIANRLTNVPGASEVFRGGFVTYNNEAKEKFLGVRRETLERHGAVSEETAREMADGARRAMGSDYAIAVTGIAGPSGGTEEKPVGTVFIAVASEHTTTVWKMFNPWDRLAFKEATARQAINKLRLLLLENAR
jgi:nicotinamide-nucleotide amidase